MKARKTRRWLIVGSFCCLAIPLILIGYIGYTNSISSVANQPKANNIGLEVGNLAPHFQLKDTDGRIVSRETLQGRPTMIFFTTTWCTPCQTGAKELLRYDRETGDNAFNVVIVFVDKSETNEQIKQWKKSFGGTDWFTALDTEGMASNYQVRFLDTKYVLDKNGIIVWKDIYELKYDVAKNVLQPLLG